MRTASVSHPHVIRFYHPNNTCQSTKLEAFHYAILWFLSLLGDAKTEENVFNQLVSCNVKQSYMELTPTLR
jgi:hypothetical protein